MKKINFIIIIIGLITLIQCNTSPKEVIDDVKFEFKIEEPLGNNTLLLSDFIDSISIVSLETTNSSLLAHASNMCFNEERIYIADDVSQKLIVFSSEGKYLQTLDKIGQGPDEYIALTDFVVDSNLIYILDMQGRSILLFDKELRFQKRIKIEVVASKIAVDKGNIWLYCPAGQNKSDCELIRIDKSGKTKEYIERSYDSDNVTITNWGEGNIFVKNQTGLFYSATFSNKVYQLTDSLKTNNSFIDISFGKYTLPDEMNTFSLKSVFYNAEFPYVLKSYFFITDSSFMIVNYSDKEGEQCYSFLNSVTKELKYGQAQNDIIPNFKRFLPIFQYHNVLVEPISIGLINDEDFNGILDFKPSLREASLEDNFILILYHLKNTTE